MMALAVRFHLTDAVAQQPRSRASRARKPCSTGSYSSGARLSRTRKERNSSSQIIARLRTRETCELTDTKKRGASSPGRAPLDLGLAVLLLADHRGERRAFLQRHRPVAAQIRHDQRKIRLRQPGGAVLRGRIARVRDVDADLGPPVVVMTVMTFALHGDRHDGLSEGDRRRVVPAGEAQRITDEHRVARTDPDVAFAVAVDTDLAERR